ncbi:MAG: hypothetical protein K2K57_12060 [Oscillospiraceae bacterium]|nr:hypothetical protein [Oscillospiraceae bacterium]
MNYDLSLDLYYKGREKLCKGEIENAIDLLNKSIELYPHAGAYAMLHKCYMKKGMPEKAFECIENAFKENPKGDMIGYEYAKMLMELWGDREGACEIIRQIMGRNSTYKKAAVLLDEIFNEKKA